MEAAETGGGSQGQVPNDHRAVEAPLYKPTTFMHLFVVILAPK